MALTDVRIRQAKPAEKTNKLSDGNRLYLYVMPSGLKLWRYRYRIDGRENLFALGEYPAMSLSDARQARDRAKELVKQGIHPAHERARSRADAAAANADTFKVLAEEWIASSRANWSEYYVSQIESYFKRDVYPRIGKRPIRSVTAADVHAVIMSVAGRGAKAAAINVRQWCSSVFCYAVAHLKADSDPAAALRRTVKRNPVENAKPLAESDIATMLLRLESYGGHRTTAIAIELLLLLFVRTIELRRAEWTDIDLDAGMWVIDAEKMKKRRKHMIPLPPQAVGLLRELHLITGSGRYLFPNSRRPREMMSATTVNRALEHMGFPPGAVTGHDFRATASTWLREMGFSSEVVEMQLAHAKKNRTEAAYNHAQFVRERTVMMRRWADTIDGLRKKSMKNGCSHVPGVAFDVGSENMEMMSARRP